MKPEIKTAWIAALRSGEYKQGQRTMRTSDGRFCCLGVLCDLHAKAHGEQWTEPESSSDWWRYMHHGADVPQAVQDWAGLKSANPKVHSKGVCEALSDVNDCPKKGQPLSFAEIAALIEEQL